MSKVGGQKQSHFSCCQRLTFEVGHRRKVNHILEVHTQTVVCSVLAVAACSSYNTTWSAVIQTHARVSQQNQTTGFSNLLLAPNKHTKLLSRPLDAVISNTMTPH